MKVFTAVLAVMAIATSTLAQDTSNKAASNKRNCDCQCNNYTWRDSYGKLQGNCKSSDKTKGQWCYIDLPNNYG